MTPMEEWREQAAKIEPCPLPWCRSHTNPEEGANRLPFKTGRDRWHVACPYCATRGPTCKTREQAIDAWNTRALPAPVALPQAGEVTAWLYERDDERVVELSRASPALVESRGWTETALGRIPTPTETPTAAAPDDGLMGRYREALESIAYVARSPVTMQETARKALSTATGDEAQQGEG